MASTSDLFSKTERQTSFYTCIFEATGLESHSMYSPVATRDPAAVEREVRTAYLAMFPDGDKAFVPRIFGWAVDCFTGAYRDYQAVDAKYHDFEHTLQGALCMARLLHGRDRAKIEPRVVLIRTWITDGTPL